MPTSRIEFNPLDISREAYRIVATEKTKLLFAGGVFYLFACLLLFVTKASGDKSLTALGEYGYSAAMFLGCQAVAMIACAKALGVETPFLPSALLGDRTFWRFVGATLAGTTVAFLTGLAFLIVAAVIVPDPKALTSISQPEIAPVLAILGIGALVAGWVALKATLMAPAILLSEKVSVRASWRRTRRMEFRLLAALVLTAALLIVLQSLSRGYASYVGSSELQVLAALFSTVVRLIQSSACGALAGLVFARVATIERAAATVAVTREG
jgi:hypothetical protein